MILRAGSAVYWPGINEDIEKTRASCWTCHSIAPSQPNMPPVVPTVPSYPFQHLSSDYFQLYNHHYLIVVDRYSGWFNIYQGSGGAKWLVKNFTKLFQDVGIAESVTTDGGPTYMSDEFRECMKKFGVHHRVSSVGFPHGNCRAEVSVKTAKRLLRDHLNPSGDLDTMAITKALLQHRNTPDRDLGMSPAELLFGRKLKDFLPSRPNEPPNSMWPNFRQEWKDTAHWRELALQRRSSKINEKLLEHTKNLKPLQLNDTVLVQNQLGNHPKRWNKRGTVIEVLPHRQYRIRMDGSRRISLRNRQFLRKFTPIEHSLPNYTHKEQRSETEDPVQPAFTYPNIPCPVHQEQKNTGGVSEHEDNTELPTLLHPAPVTLQSENRECNHPAPEKAPPVGGGGSARAKMEATPVLRRSTRSTRGQTGRFEDFVTGSQFENATDWLAFMPYAPDYAHHGPTFLDPSCGQPYVYRPSVGHVQVGYMWNSSGWGIWPMTNYVW